MSNLFNSVPAQVQVSLARTECDRLLTELNWSHETPRVADWLYRVKRALMLPQSTTFEQLPESVLVSLAKFLDLWHKCDRLIKLLTWNWTQPEVREVMRRYGYAGKATVSGYRELLAYLNEQWFDVGGGF